MPAGAEELAAAYRDYALTAEDFANRFTRLARLRDRAEEGTLDAELRPIPVRRP